MFYLVNFFIFIVCVCVFFGWSVIEKMYIINVIVNDGLGLVFLFMYVGLVLFWSDIYYAARGEAARTRCARMMFYVVNVVVYVIEFGIWFLMVFGKEKWCGDVFEWVFSGTLAFASASVAFVFAFYGLKLYVMFWEFLEGLMMWVKKICEIGSVIVVCVIVFVVCCVVLFFATGGEAKYVVDVYALKMMNVVYYVVVEILLSVLVLYVFWKLLLKCVCVVFFVDEDGDASARVEEVDTFRYSFVVDSDDDESDDEDVDVMGL